jgi:hypothetical protein
MQMDRRRCYPLGNMVFEVVPEEAVILPKALGQARLSEALETLLERRMPAEAGKTAEYPEARALTPQTTTHLRPHDVAVWPGECLRAWIPSAGSGAMPLWLGSGTKIQSAPKQGMTCVGQKAKDFDSTFESLLYF